MPLLAIGLGLFLLLGKRSVKWGGIYLSIGVLSFLGIHSFLMPRFAEWQETYNTGYSYTYLYSNRYSELLGGKDTRTIGELVLSILLHPVRVIRLLLVKEKIVFCAALLFPLGVLPLFSPTCLLIALPNLLTLILSNEEWMYSFNAYYAGAFTPALYYGACLAIKDSGSGLRTWWFTRVVILFKSSFSKLSIYQILFGTTLVFALACWPLLKPIVALPQPSPQIEYVRDLLEEIPSNAAVGSTPRYAGYLSSRREVWAFDPMTSVSRIGFDSNKRPIPDQRSMKSAMKRADWMFIDSSESVNPAIGNELFYKDFYSAVKDRKWCIRFSDERYLIAQRSSEQNQCSQDTNKEAGIAKSLFNAEGGLNTYEYSSRTEIKNELSPLINWNKVAGKFDVSDVIGSEIKNWRVERISGTYDSRLETSFLRDNSDSSQSQKSSLNKVYVISAHTRSSSDTDQILKIGCSDGIGQSSEQELQLTESYSKNKLFCPIRSSVSEEIHVYILVPDNIEFDIRDIDVSYIDERS